MIILHRQVPRLLLDVDARKIGIPHQDFACLIKVHNELVQPKLAFKESKEGSRRLKHGPAHPGPFLLRGGA